MIPGYVVTMAGDTLRGHVAPLADIDAAQRVEFLATDEDVVQILTPLHLSAYGTDDGRTYVARNLIPNYEGRVNTLFLQELVRGPVTLYTYAFTVPARGVSNRVDLLSDRDEYVRFAVETDDEQVFPLYRLQWQATHGSTDIIRDNIYQRTLADIFAACAPMARRASGIQYRRASLVSAVSRYNQCVGEPGTIARSASNQSRLGIGVRASIRGGVGQAAVINRSTGDAADARVVPYGGVMLELIAERLPGRPAVVTELALKQKGTSAEHHESLGPFAARHYNHSIVGGSVGISYTADVVGRPYASLGVTSGYLLGNEGRIGQGFRFIQTYSWESGFYGEIGGRAYSTGLGDLIVGLRGETTLLSDGPIGRRQTNVRTGDALGHRNHSAYLVFGLRF